MAELDYSDGVTGKPEVADLQSAVANVSLTILELAVGASGQQQGRRFPSLSLNSPTRSGGSWFLPF